MGGWTIDDFCVYGYNDPDEIEEPTKMAETCSSSNQNTDTSILLLIFVGLFLQIVDNPIHRLYCLLKRGL